ncbi:hypothetical protein M758_7G123300 [Ceratodon purpureus]|nr:hypothetical protein M758_7G123300 [Ceratodon purpureus]
MHKKYAGETDTVKMASLLIRHSPASAGDSPKPVHGRLTGSCSLPNRQLSDIYSCDILLITSAKLLHRSRNTSSSLPSSSSTKCRFSLQYPSIAGIISVENRPRIVWSNRHFSISHTVASAELYIPNLLLLGLFCDSEVEGVAPQGE